MERFNKALEHDNTLYPVYKNMAFLSIHLGRYEEAEQYFLKAKAFASDDKEAYHNLLLDIARYYLSRDEFEKSIKYYQEAINIKRDNRTIYDYAIALVVANRWIEGEKIFRELIETNPAYWGALLIETELQDKNFNDVINLLDQIYRDKAKELQTKREFLVNLSKRLNDFKINMEKIDKEIKEVDKKINEILKNSDNLSIDNLNVTLPVSEIDEYILYINNEIKYIDEIIFSGLYEKMVEYLKGRGDSKNFIDLVNKIIITIRKCSNRKINLNRNKDEVKKDIEKNENYIRKMRKGYINTFKVLFIVFIISVGIYLIIEGKFDENGFSNIIVVFTISGIIFGISYVIGIMSQKNEELNALKNTNYKLKKELESIEKIESEIEPRLENISNLLNSEITEFENFLKTEINKIAKYLSKNKNPEINSSAN